MRQFSIYKTFGIALLVAGSVTIVSVARAATLGVVVNNAAPDIGQPIRVDVPLDTQGDDANAIQAQILFPASQFTLRSINDGASPVSFWIEPPAEVASGVVAFSGIVPGGFQGAASSVVSLWLMPTTSGAGVISLGNVQVLRNDGAATPITTATGTAEVDVSTIVASSTHTRPVSFITPQPFTPVITQDPNIFGGKYFLVFSTTDKGSGIAYYQVLETQAGSWQTATSPYLLQDQSLESDIYVRAVDNAGNFIVAKLPAQHPVSLTHPSGSGVSWVVALAIILVLLCFLAFFAIARRRRNRRVR